MSLDQLWSKAVDCHQKGLLEQAEVCYRTIIREQPGHVEANHMLAMLLHQRGRSEESLPMLEQAINLAGDQPALLSNTALVLIESHKPTQAIGLLERALRVDSQHYGSLLNLSLAYQKLGDSESATRTLSRLPGKEKLKSHQVYRIARLFQQLGAWLDAQEWFNHYLQTDPKNAEALLRRGLASAQLGLTKPAIRDYQQALSQDPEYHQVHSNLVSLMQYDAAYSAKEIFIEHRNWAERHAPPESVQQQWIRQSEDRERKIHVGWISPRFDSALMIGFLPSTLRELPTDQFVHHFYDTRGRPDIPVAFRGLGTFHDISKLNDPELSEQFRRDEIDIAMDLCGHNPGNRLKALAKRLAPVQMCWLDYFCTTGIPAIDYWLSDPHMSPPGSEVFFTEELMFFEHTRLSYTQPPFTVAPSRSNREPGEAVFGSFNRLGKLTDPVVRLWAEIAGQPHRGRLVLKAREFRDPRVRDFTRQRFLDAGLAGDRLELRGPSSYQQLLTEYNDIDIALDPFPFTGYATTCDALWMGLPVISMAGETVVSRQGLSLLQNIGRPNWVAQDSRRYGVIARELAIEIAENGWDRQAARNAFANSPVCDAKSQGAELSQLLIKAWQKSVSG